MPLEKILEEVAQGSDKAFRQLFEMYKDNLYHTALRLAKDEFLADEVLQETFLQIWVNRSKLLDVRDFDAWLYRIAKNVFLARLRKKTLSMEPLDLYFHNLISQTTSIDSADYKELEEHYEIAIARLPEKQRLAYQFIKLEGLSRKEVADILQVSTETVKSNYEEATNKVRSYLIKYLENKPLVLILLFLLKR